MATLVYNNRPSLRPTRAFNTLLGQMLRETGGTQPAPSFVPAADIVETAQGFELHLALPGVKKDAVKIEFLDGQLVVSGERLNPFAATKGATAPAAETTSPEGEAATEAAPRFRRTETNFGHFQRSFRLPETVNVKAIGAELTDGILRVTLPFDTDKVTKQTIEVR